jgi:hypothetical protein
MELSLGPQDNPQMETSITTTGRGLYWLKLKDAVRNCIGWSLERLRTPARFKPFEFVDPETNETVYVYTDRLYSVLCVGQRRFYFDRITGALDGTSLELPDLVTGRVELSD